MKQAPVFLLAAVACCVSGLDAREGAHFLTTTFGNSERCEHRGTLTHRDARLRFDLSSLPPTTRILRAVLRVSSEGHRTGQALRLVPAGLPGASPLPFLPPTFDSLELTEIAALWVKDPSANQGLVVEDPAGVSLETAVLEVSCRGTTSRPIPQVTDLRADHRSGQTFLTWKEIEDVVGADEPTFEEFERAVLDARARRKVVYRIYRSSRPITVQSLVSTEPATEPAATPRLIREVPEVVPVWNLKAVRNTEHPDQGTPTKRSPLRPGYNLALGDRVHRYRIQDDHPPLPCGAGLAVLTARTPGARYYAVTTSMDGREAVDSLNPGASLEEPVLESVAPHPAFIRQRTQSAGEGEPGGARVDVTNSWIEPPYHNVPGVSEAFVVRWNDLAPESKRGGFPLLVNHGTHGSTATELASPGWHAARRHVPGAWTLGLAEGSLWQGFHECIGTLRGYEHGVVHNYPQRRVLAATRWALSLPELAVDPERVTLWGQLGAWALRHGELFAVVMSNGYGNLVIGKIPQQHGWKWGPYPEGCRNWLGIDQWEHMNLARWIRENPKEEIPYWICSPAYGAYPAHTIGDFGFQPWPEMIHAMVSTRRAFAANWSTNGPGPTRALHSLVPRIRLHQSLPAFTNGSLDHSPGDGDHADAQKGGGINLYPRWEPETIIDEVDRWEITVYLSDDAPAERATVDLTPRRCQKFHPADGDRLRWTVSPLDSADVLDSGQVEADQWGLVTIRKLEIRRERQRVRFERSESR